MEFRTASRISLVLRPPAYSLSGYGLGPAGWRGTQSENSSSLLGGLLFTTIGLAAFSRADTPAAKRRDSFVCIDEFQSFTTLAVSNLFFLSSSLLNSGSSSFNFLMRPVSR